jgi:hypothetical protein
VDQAAEHSQVDGVAGVEYLPLRAYARLDEQMVRARQLQEQDVQQEGGSADLLGDRLGAQHDRRDGVPDGDMSRDVDLLR